MGTKSFNQKNPVISYFAMTFLISWIGAFMLVANKLIHREPIGKLDGILMFPIMLLGPFISGITLTGITGGQKALKELFGRLNPKKVPAQWYLSLLIPPFSILFVLIILSFTLSKEYSPHFFGMGFLFGIPAGILEEIGWMGFAFPNMSRQRTALSNSITLGLVWGLWHLPVINFLGTASPHGSYWVSYFLTFTIAMTAIRVIIVWVYCNSKNLLLSQLMHISSTGFLVMLSPSPMTIQREPIWYLVYSIVLWVLVIFIVSRFGKNLILQKSVGKS